MRIRDSLAELQMGVGHIDLSLDHMDDLTGEGNEQVGDPSSNSSSTTFRPISHPSPSDSSSSSFQGFASSTPSGGTAFTTKAQLKGLSSAESCRPKEKKKPSKPKPEPSRKDSRKKQGRDRSPAPASVPLPDNDDPSGDPRPGPSKLSAPEVDLQAFTATVLAQLSSFQKHLEKLDSKVSTLSSDQSGQPRAETPAGDGMPPADSLPNMDRSNPWRSARFAPVSEGMLTIEGIGTRPLGDFERFPPGAQLPFCYVRLSAQASVREDRVPKETVIYPRDQAQTAFLKVVRAAECVNTRLSPEKGGFTMFTTSEDTVNPFASKVAEAVFEASLEDKKPVSLREEEATSLIFPADSEIWRNVAATFTVGRLKPECASDQFDEELPKVPEGMLNAEYAARSRLARTLNTFTFAELLMTTNTDFEALKVLVKGMVTSLKQDLSDFVAARKQCRRHVFKHATIRHEPKKLIEGSVWGPNLFSATDVQAAIDAAAASNQNLRERWNLSYKRRFQEGSASSKSGKKAKRSPQAKGGNAGNYRIPKKPAQQQQPQQAQFAVLQTLPSTSGNPQGPPVFVLQPQSPAFHAPYEQASSFPGFQQSRGGGGSQRRGGGRGALQARGRGSLQKRGKPRSNPQQ